MITSNVQTNYRTNEDDGDTVVMHDYKENYKLEEDYETVCEDNNSAQRCSPQ